MQVHYSEGVATHTGPESCAQSREGLGEALSVPGKAQALGREGGDFLKLCEGTFWVSSPTGQGWPPTRSEPCAAGGQPLL